MPRGPRLDAPGKLFHVMNRGTARRTMFERTADLRFFLSRLAHAVRRQEIDVMAYAVLTTHFHLILRSHGHLSSAMRRVQGEYTQHFNRSRNRDGALQRGRFLSKPINSRLYLVNAVPYVDENPVQAGLAARPEDYPWCSACAWDQGRHRQWLSTEFAFLSGAAEQREARLARAAFIEARLNGRGTESVYEDLIDAAPEHIAVRMQQRAELADGTAPGLPIAGVVTVESMLRAKLEVGVDTQILVPGGKRHRIGILLRAGLLRELASLSFARISHVLETTDARAKRLYGLHLRCVRNDPVYRAWAAKIAHACFEVLAQP